MFQKLAVLSAGEVSKQYSRVLGRVIVEAITSQLAATRLCFSPQVQHSCFWWKDKAYMKKTTATHISRARDSRAEAAASGLAAFRE